MEKVSKILQIQFWTGIALSLLLVVAFETELLPSGILSDKEFAEVMLLFILEPLSLAAIFGALFLFRIRKVDADLKRRKEAAVLSWGTLRTSLLTVPLVTDTLLYYLFMNTSFGYLAIMVVLAMFFIYPNLSRCQADVEIVEEKK